MRMTTEIDSDTPNSHPYIDMIATTLTITIVTHPIATEARMIFWVAINKIQKAKVIAMIIPLTADDTNALSEAIQAQKTPAFCSADFNSIGALARYLTR
jgi:hypothetical protein